MGHHHDHPHDHDHDGHDHDHGHHSHDGQGSQPGLDAKLARLLGHWAKHNQEHALSYRDWAEQARKAGHAGIADLLETVAAQTLGVAAQLENALTAMAKDQAGQKP